MKLQEIFTEWNTRKAVVVGLVSLPCAIAIAISACMNNKAGAKTLLSTDQSPKGLMLSAQQSPGHLNKQHSAMGEWSAFSIYHPYSQINEESLFQSFKKGKDGITEGQESIQTENEKSESAFLLSGQALVPIFRATFGDQIRNGSDVERDPWFTTHPSALFTPEQMKALCGNDLSDLGDGNFEICWKPKLTDQYLSALTDFATDACPQLVAKEFRSNLLHLNKLVRTRDFREQNLKNFATNFLKIPADEISETWLATMTSQATDALKANLEDESTEQNSNQRAELSTPDLYTLSCQSIILSREFYSR
ncbi:MAG: hypothetical protein FJY29_08070 [Betaproteobacteria bacterium]|nr:hypothetical protein [Betaproteobacteria bacterium]